MSSMRKDNGQSPDTASTRRSGVPAKNGIDSSHHGSSLNSSNNYDQRRSHNYGGEYGTANNVGLTHSTADYMNYYSSYHPNEHYGWASSGNSGFYHHHPQAVNSPITGGYMDHHMTLFGNGGNGPAPPDHTGYYYNYFPSGPANGSDYNTWSGPNLVTPQRTSKHAEFYHSPVNDYIATGGYGRGGGALTHQQVEEHVGRMRIYDDPPPVAAASGNYHRHSSGGDSKKKSWANVASQPAKSCTSMVSLGVGRGKGRGISIGGIPGSSKSEHYAVSGRGISTHENGSLWAPLPLPPNNLQPSQRNTTSASPPAATGQSKLSPRGGELSKTVDSVGMWNRGGGRNASEYSKYGVNDVSALYSKRRDDEAAPNGSAADAEDYDDKRVESKVTATANYDQLSNDTQGHSRRISSSDYNPKEFTLPLKEARYFVIKSYSEDDVHRSIKYGIWCSTEHGNKRLDTAYKEREGKGPIYLCFSVNASGHFCGVAQMMSPLDYEKSSGVWAQDKWKGQFVVKWIYVKDVPNQQLRHIRLENNENKPVTNSRDTQEVPMEKGRQVLKIIHQYAHTTSLFDDFAHYEKRQEEEKARKGKRGNSDEY